MSRLLLALLLSAGTASASPNVLVIVADDLGYADLSLHGGRGLA